MTRVWKERFGDHLALILEDGAIRVSLLPELGSKMNSLVSKSTGRELLAAPKDPEAYHRSAYAAPYGKVEATGFDEAFPTVGECFYPDGVWKATVLPEQGELWSVPWDYTLGRETIHFRAGGTRLPYMLEKTVCLPSEGTLRISYQLTNSSAHELKFIWAGHVLLDADPGSAIKLPATVDHVRVYWSLDERLGKMGAIHPWPETTDLCGQRLSLDVFGDRTLGFAEKLFTPRLRSGYCALYFPRSDEHIRMHFPPDLIPYVGIWINLGGWPRSDGVCHLGLEPTNSNVDRLDLASQGLPNEYGIVGPRSQVRWDLWIKVGSGQPCEIFPSVQAIHAPKRATLGELR